MRINNKTIEHLPMSSLISTVKGDFSALDDEGLIDEGRLVKVIMACNEKLGISIREMKECAIPVEDYKALLPLDFDKLYYVCALDRTTQREGTIIDPYDNEFDADVIYDAKIDRMSLGANVENYTITIKRQERSIIVEQKDWVVLDIDKGSQRYCASNCPNIHNRNKGKIRINGDELIAPFEKGLIYIMYLGNMRDEEGNLLFPFHPLITPWYEWSIKEKILMDAVFNSDRKYGDLLQLAQRQKSLAWIDAFNICTDKSYGEYVNMQKRKEYEYYKKYFKYFQ